VHGGQSLFLAGKGLSERFRIFRKGVCVTQDALFSEDIYDALGDIVRAAGGAKAVGPRLRANVPIERSRKWVLDCLNRDREERFDPDDVLTLLRIGREVGCHSAVHFLCDEAGYARPAPIEPQDEAAALMRQYIDAVQTLKRLTDKGERLGLRVA
jgi:hypothetical protein